MASLVDGIKTSRVSPAFLHGNSTSHTWPFSAVAELIDNAYDPDVSASELWIDKRIINNMETLTFVDNGNGMTAEKLHKMLSFGYCEKVQIGNVKPIGYYGNGFKSGSMRLGQDAMVLTRSTKSTSVGFLSQSYLKAVNADSVLVPIVSWDLPSMTRRMTAEMNANLEAVLKYSLFQTEHQLLTELKALEKMKTGTNIIIYNLKTDKSGNCELDFTSDLYDIRNPETHVIDLTSINRPIHQASPEYRRSLREYCSILYLKPRMKIVLRGQKVKTKLISKSLSQTENDVYKPSWLGHPIKLTFGFTNSAEPENFGLMMYHKNRLIRAYEKIGCQNKGSGVGVVGVVEVNFLEPVHNKQDFNRDNKYSSFMHNTASKLGDYYLEKTQSPTSQTQQQTQSQLPDWKWVQCDNCLSWRRLPTGYVEKLPEKWYCRLNPDAAFNRCDIPEEPEDDDEALQPTYQKTYKKQLEEKKRQAKTEEALKARNAKLEEERKIKEKEKQLQEKEKLLQNRMKQIKEFKRQKEELQVVSSSQDGVKDHKPTIADLEQAKKSLQDYQKKYRAQKETIEQLERKNSQIEENRDAMLRLTDNLRLSQNSGKNLVDKVASMVGTSSSAVSSSSHTLKAPQKRKNDNPVQGSGGKAPKVKTEGTVPVAISPDTSATDDKFIDLTLDEAVEMDISSANTAKIKTNSKITDKLQHTPSKGNHKESDTSDNYSSAERDSEGYTEMKDETDVKPDKEELDKQIQNIEIIKKDVTCKGSQTVPTVVKFASPEEVDLLKLKPVEQKQILLQKARELDDTKKNLTSLQGNIWQLLKIIVPDFDYGKPEDIENIILDFIRVNGEQSSPSSEA